jgi:hypothetical protein
MWPLLVLLLQAEKTTLVAAVRTNQPRRKPRY